MTWSSEPGTRIPDNVVQYVRERDRDRCQLAYPGCTGWYEQVDHINNVARTGLARNSAEANDPAQLQCVCKSCHTIKTQAEATYGRTWWKRPASRPLWLR